MRLLKPKIEKKTEPVTRQEFEALSKQLEAFKTIATISIAALGFAMAASPGMPDASPRNRLEKLAAVAGLDPSESAELRSFLKALDKAGKAESQREFDESARRTRPKTFDDFRPPSWRG